MGRPKLNREQEKPAEPKPDAVQLVRMVKDDGSTADVHPAEVENYKLGDWKVA